MNNINKIKISLNNPKAWLFKIMSYQPVPQLERIKELIRLAIKDGR